MKGGYQVNGLLMLASFGMTVAVLVAPGTALAAPPDNVPDGMAWVNGKGLVDNVLEMDAAATAKATGMSIERALARMRASQRLDPDLAALEADHSGYAGARWDGDELVLMFKGDVPRGRIAEIRDKSNVPLRTEGVSYSLRDQDRRAKAAIDELLESGVNAKDIFVTIDMRSGEVLAAVRAAGSEQRAAVRSNVEERLGHKDVRVEFTNRPVFREELTVGGGELRDATQQVCTGGFTVEKNGTGGIASAGHCPNNVDYRNILTGATHNATFKQGHEGEWGDFAWYTTNGSEPDDFFYNNAGDYRDVTGTKQALVELDAVVKGYGNRSNNYEGTVVKRGYTAQGDLGRLICLDDWYTQGGDSGGPIYNGGSAIGFHWGHGFWDGRDGSCFSQARFLDDAIGATINKDD